MKKLSHCFFLAVLICIMFLFLGATRYSLKIHESFTVNSTEISRCSSNGKNYVLIYGNYDEKYRSLVINETKEKTAKSVYGEIYHAYYTVKQKKKKRELYAGEPYEKIEDNEQGVLQFLYSLTDFNELKRYKSFKFLDNNKGRVEKFDDDEIGGNAGYLMQINAEDFSDYLDGID